MKKIRVGLAAGIAIGLAIGVGIDNIAVGVAIGAALGIALDAAEKNKAKAESEAAAKNNPANLEKTAEKDARVAQVLAEVERKGTITNNEVEALLAVSDATAERYLQELENQGKIAQEGTVGKTVSYKIL